MRSREYFEKGLGMPLETFMNIITEGFYYKSGKDIYYQRNAIFIGNGYCPHSNSMVTTHYLASDYDSETQTKLKDQHYWDWARKEDVFNFQDYGKTWSLNREDLEKGETECQKN